MIYFKMTKKVFLIYIKHLKRSRRKIALHLAPSMMLKWLAAIRSAPTQKKNITVKMKERLAKHAVK